LTYGLAGLSDAAAARLTTAGALSGRGGHAVEKLIRIE
jgi:hypothetical protein